MSANRTFWTFVALTIALATVAFAAEPARSPSYTADQAYHGRLEYYQHCAECHAGGLEGHFGPALAGGNDALQYETGSAAWSYFTVTMPHGAPGTLTKTTYLDIMAFLYQQHHHPAGNTPLTEPEVAKDLTLLGP